jgi:GNAT superfamily N-acetyltransferase
LSLIEIQPIAAHDRDWVVQLLNQEWTGTTIASRGRVFETRELDGFVAWRGGERVGLATVVVDELGCELLTLNSLAEGIGVGSALLGAVTDHARRLGCHRVWLSTTNDHFDALRFYQKRGYCLAALRVGHMAEARRVKPSIPEFGLDGIPIRDELELELVLGDEGSR